MWGLGLVSGLGFGTSEITVYVSGLRFDGFRV